MVQLLSKMAMYLVLFDKVALAVIGSGTLFPDVTLSQ